MISLIYSIFNRSKLFTRGLESILNQNFDLSNLEIVIVDDKSTEDIKNCFEPLIGKCKIKYIVYNHKKSPLYIDDETWYHTQAISANIGLKKASGEIACISQPEMIHSPDSLRMGQELAKQNKSIFCELLLGSQRFNEWLETNTGNFDEMLAMVQELGLEYQFAHQPPDFYEMYWYIMFFHRQTALDIGGVDLEYQNGVYAEDDQFKMRMRMAGFPEVWGGRPSFEGTTKDYIIGIHQSHSDEKHKNQQRDGRHWEKGAQHNRELFRQFCSGGEYLTANKEFDFDIWGEDLIISEIDYEIS